MAQLNKYLLALLLWLTPPLFAESAGSEELPVICDESGRSIQEIKPDGVSLFYTYDEEGRLIQMHSSDGTVDYELTYNDASQVIRVDDHIENLTSLAIFDGEGRKIQEMLATGHALTYTYNERGQRTALFLPDHSVILYDWQDDRLAALSHQRDNRLTTHLFSPGRSSDQMVDNIGILTLKEKEIITPFLAETAWCDESERIIAIETTDQLGTNRTHFDYDDEGRLCCESGFTNQLHRYDDLDNRIFGNSLYNMQCQLERVGACSYIYDANGNLTTRLAPKGVTDYTYDALNRLTKVHLPNGMSYRYSYDYDNRRLCKRTFRDGYEVRRIDYLYDGLCDIGAIDESGALIELRLIGDQFETEIGTSVMMELNNKRFAVINDIRGSVAALIPLTDRDDDDLNDYESPQIIERYYYSAFGRESIMTGEGEPLKKSAVQNPWHFLGKRRDPETGFIYSGERYYDTATGRWITPDPRGLLEGINRYRFAMQDPINRSHHAFSPMQDRVYDCGVATNESPANSPSLWAKGRNAWQQLSRYIDQNLSLEAGYKPTMHQWAESLFGESMLVLLGYHQEDASVNVCGNGELSDKVRVTAINGMLNIHSWAQSNAELISTTHGGTNVHFVHGPTKGWFLDLSRSIMVKFVGYPTEEAELLAHLWREMIQEMGGTDGGGLIVHYAHSIGGADTLLAKQYLTPDEQKMIRVISLGSPLILPHDGFHSVINYISIRDGIFIFAPLDHLVTFLNTDKKIVYLDSYWSIPLTDHLLNRGTYKDLLGKLGQEFLEEFASQ